MVGLLAIGTCMHDTRIDASPTLVVGLAMVGGGLLGLLAWLLNPRPPEALLHADGSLTISHRRLTRDPGMSGGLVVGGLAVVAYSLILWLSFTFETHRPAKPYYAYMLDAFGVSMLMLGLICWKWEELELRIDDEGLHWNGDSWGWDKLRSYERVGNQLWPLSLEWEAAVLDAVERELQKRLATPAPSPAEDWSSP